MYHNFMLQILREKATQEQITISADDLAGYIKVVVDIERHILTAGGERHVDGEQMLLTDGSHQHSLWGGGYDTDTKETDYNSMIISGHLIIIQAGKYFLNQSGSSLTKSSVQYYGNHKTANSGHCHESQPNW